MSTFRGWWIRVTGALGRNERERRMEQEFQTHLEMEIESNLRSGMSAEEARRSAMISAGGMQSARENYRQQGGLPFFETLFQDVRYGIRVLRKTPGFTFVAVLTLALGIGANTAIFSIINAVLLSPLPFRDPDRLVQLWETESAPGNYPFSGPDYLEWQAQTKTLEGMSAYGWPSGFNASKGTDAQSVVGLAIQANFFSLLGVQPLFGRTFASDENQAGKDRVVILTYGFWKKFYGGQKDIINQKVMLDGEEHTIVGVMPRALNFPSEVELFVPMDMTKAAMHRRGSHWFRALGKMKPGESVASVHAELATIAKNLERQFPESNDKVSAIVVPLREEITGSSRDALLVLLGAVGLVLLVACFNVANLLLARATGRQREVALRAVLGASRSRIIRQLLTESVLLSLMGALLGLAGAWWCIRLFQNAESLPIPRTNPIELNITVLMFTFLVSVAVGIIFGLAPALQTSKLDLGEELKSGSQSVLSPRGWNRRLRDLLVVAEIALSLALLAGAGLLIRSFQNLRTAETGVKAENVVTFSTLLPKAGYQDISRQRAFFDQLLERLAHSPGVTGAALATELPVEGGSNGYIAAEGDTDPSHANLLVEENYITSGYFAALGIPFLSGNNFSPADMDRAAEMTQRLIALRKSDPNSKVTPPDVSFPVIISQSMAKTFWPKQDPVGKVYRSQHGTTPYRVIGVVGDVSTGGVRQQSLPQSYHAFTEALGDSGAYARVVVRSTMPTTAVLPEVRSQLRQLDSSLAIFQPRTMTEVISESTQDAAMETWLLGSFAGLALLLAAVGLYSVLSYLVNQRTREIGIRMALGAGQSTILRLVMGHAAVLTGIGIVCGIVGSLILTRFLESLLYGVKGRDPVTFIGVVALLALVSLVACYVPARRAMRVDPLVALRYE